jgi:hypothetical protein
MSAATNMKLTIEHIEMEKSEVETVENSTTPTPVSEEELEPVVDAKTWIVVAVCFLRCADISSSR